MTAWSAHAIRRRLTAWYIGVLSLMLVGYSAAVYLGVRHEFLEDADARPEEVGAQLGEVRSILMLGIPIVVGLSGVAGYVLAGRALVPIESSFDRLRRFTADASHELRTPLAVVRGVGEVALSRPQSPEEYREAIGGILEEVDRLTRLVDSLLRLSRADAGTIAISAERVDLGELAGDVTASLSLLADERRQRLVVEARGPVAVVADRVVLREAIANVVDNAIKYGPQGSLVSVCVSRQHDVAVVVVTDEGPGIAPEYRERVFDRFFRVDDARSRASGGTGLGLAIAKWAVEANGGRISVDGGRAGGAAFRISLPRLVEGTR